MELKKTKVAAFKIPKAANASPMACTRRWFCICMKSWFIIGVIFNYNFSLRRLNFFPFDLSLSLSAVAAF